PRAQEGCSVRHRPDPGRVRRPRRRRAALREPARRRHRRRAYGAVRRAGRAHRAGPPRHQPRHLRPRRAAGRERARGPPAGPVHHAGPAFRAGLSHPGNHSPGKRRRSLLGASPVQFPLACYPHARTGEMPVRGFLQPASGGPATGLLHLKANDVTHPAILVLEDGTVFEGESVGASGLAVGEVVFNTAMTGYQEIVTDPSYARQLVTLTYPHIGNTGCTGQDDEAAKVWSAGLIVRDVPRRPSNWRSEAPLQDWLAARGVVAIAGIDTRKLTRLLRERGAQNGALMAGEGIDVDTALEAARKFPGLQGMDLAQVVSTTERYAWTEGQLDLDANAFVTAQKKFRVVAYDFG